MEAENKTRCTKCTSVARIILWSSFTAMLVIVSWNIFHLAMQPKLTAALVYPGYARKISNFELTDINHQKFDNNRLLGKWSLLFFGYRHCPDVCPNTLQTIKWALNTFERKQPAADIQVVFISVDPERDSLETLKEYVTYFDSRFLGATAELAELSSFSESMGVEYARVDNEDVPDHYWMSHSAEVFVFNPAGERFAVLPPPHDAIAISEDLGAMISRL